MKLKELLKTIGDRTIYIGAGGAFLVAGAKKEVKLPVKRTEALEKMENPPLFQPKGLEDTFEKFVVHRKDIGAAIKRMDKALNRRYEITRSDLTGRMTNAEIKYGADDPAAVHAKKKLERLQKPTPLMEREVKETYERITEDALNIIVEGSETGRIWSIYEARPFVAEYNIETLIGETFRSVVRDYRESLKHELDQWDNLLAQLQKTIRESKSFEKYLRYLTGDDEKEKFPTKLFAIIDAEKIIDQARYTVITERIAQAKKENETP